MLSMNHEDFDRAYVERFGLKAFIEKAWPIIVPNPFIDGWHIGAICEHLEAVHRGEIKDIVINIPPGCMKSLSCSVFFPIWEWIQDPTMKYISASFSDKLVQRDARNCRRIIKSDWFRARWGKKVSINDSGDVADTIKEFWTTANGMRFSTTVKGEGTGWHANRIIVDDPLKPALADCTKGALEEVIDWWSGTMSTRNIDENTSRIIIMQRLHEKDLAGYCIEQGYYHLCLPMKYRSNHPFLYKEDPRTKERELLWPERKTEKAVAEEEKGLTPIGVASQHDQVPTPESGGVFKKEWMDNYWTELPRGALSWVQSWDHTLGSISEHAAYVAGHIYCIDGDGKIYLIDRVRKRMEYPEMRSYVKLMSEKYPQARTKYFENRASGPSLQQDLRSQVNGIVMVKADSSTGGKLVRAHATTGLLAAGDIFFPHPKDAILLGKRHPCPWVGELQTLMIRFKGSGADEADDVDAFSQAIGQLNNSTVARFVRNMRGAEL